MMYGETVVSIRQNKDLKSKKTTPNLDESTGSPHMKLEQERIKRQGLIPIVVPLKLF